jgi:trehalose 6-phosphate phosphatase
LRLRVDVGTPVLADLRTLFDKVRRAQRVFVALDFDGTLAPIVAVPERAAIPAHTMAILRRLHSARGTSIAILSGRSASDVEARVGLDCIYAGNHGMEIRGGGMNFVLPAAHAAALERACADLRAALAAVDGVRVERKELTATVHYRMANPDLTEWIAGTVELALRPYAPALLLRQARKAWEIRPQVAWNKGTALEFIVRQTSGTLPLVICAGDDAADEDMFGAFPEAISIQVGSAVRTSARYRVSAPGELSAFLSLVADARERSGDRGAPLYANL